MPNTHCTDVLSKPVRCFHRKQEGALNTTKLKNYTRLRTSDGIWYFKYTPILLLAHDHYFRFLTGVSVFVSPAGLVGSASVFALAALSSGEGASVFLADFTKIKR